MSELDDICELAEEGEAELHAEIKRLREAIEAIASDFNTYPDQIARYNMRRIALAALNPQEG